MLEAGKYVVLSCSYGRYLGITLQDDRVKLLATTDEDYEVTEVLENQKSKYIGDFHVNYAPPRTIQSYYDHQDPKVVEFLVQGEVL